MPSVLTKAQESLSIIIAAVFRSAPGIIYSILLAIAFLIFIWLDKTLGLKITEVYNLHEATLDQLIFLMCIASVTLPLILLIVGRLIISFKTIWLRMQYPQNQLDKKYYLINFSGHVYLVNTSKKEMHWIQTWQTAMDLNFIDKWTDSEYTLRESEIFSAGKIVKTKEGLEFNLNDYHIGKPIHTQDALTE